MQLQTATALVRGFYRPSRAVLEIRCAGDNFGDIMVGQAIEAMFEELTVVSLSSTALRRLDSAVGMKRFSRYCSLGGGTLIFASHYSSWLGDLQYAVERARPLFTFGTGVVDPAFLQHLQGLRPGRRPADPRMFEEWVACLRTFPFVSVRGVESHRILNDHGLRDVQVIGDPALYYSRDSISPKQHEKRIGINLSTYSHFWGDSQASTLQQMVKLIRWLQANGWTVTLFSSMAEDHVLAAQMIESEGLDRCDICTEHRDVGAYLARLEAQDIFVGVKLHTVIAACCVYTPAVMIGYQPKCYDFMATTGLERFFIRADQLEADHLIGMIENMYCDLESIQQEQFTRCQAFKRKQIDFRSRIVRHVIADTNGAAGDPRVNA